MTWQIAGILITAFLGLGVVLLFMDRHDLRQRTLKEVEASAEKQGLDEIKKNLGAEEKVRDQYAKLRDSVPDDWDSVQRLRRESALPPNGPH
jgi:uncharacterized membrane-anchored protein YhcB (DUF1043 family)